MVLLLFPVPFNQGLFENLETGLSEAAAGKGWQDAGRILLDAQLNRYNGLFMKSGPKTLTPRRRVTSTTMVPQPRLLTGIVQLAVTRTMTHMTVAVLTAPTTTRVFLMVIAVARL